MTRHPVLVLSAIAVVLIALGVAAMLRQVIPQITLADFGSTGGLDQVELEEYYTWLQSGWIYYNQAPWLITAGLVAGVVGLALAAYRAQRRIEAHAGSASATASRETSRS